MDKRFVNITNIDRGLIVRTWAHKHQGELAQMAYSDFIRLAPEPRELTGDQQYNVFLSYRSVNRAWVIALHDALVQAGHKVFLDQVALVVHKLRRTETVWRTFDGLEKRRFYLFMI